MLLYIWTVPEALFLTATMITVLYALARTTAGKAGRIIMLAGIGMGLLLTVFRALLHEFPSWFGSWLPDGIAGALLVKRQSVADTQINLYLWYGAMLLLIPLNILSAVFSWKRAAKAGKIIVSALSALLSADLLAYKAWRILWAPRSFEMGDNGVLSEEFLLRLAGWLIGLIVLAFYVHFLYKCCMRLSQDRVLWNRPDGTPGVSGYWVLRLTVALLTFLFILVIYGLILSQWNLKKNMRPDWVPELLPGLKAEVFLRLTMGNNSRAGGPLIPGFRYLISGDPTRGAYLDNGVLMLFLTALTALIPPAALFFRSLRLRDLWQNAAQKRRLRSDNRHNRRWAAMVLVSLALIMVSVTLIHAEDNKPPVIPDAEEYTIVYVDEDGSETVLTPAQVADFDVSRVEVRVPVSQVNDYNLHAFEMRRSTSQKVRWIIIQKPGSAAFGVGLDACDVCGSAGYYQRGDTVVCKKCDVVMNTTTIGLAGGCNPVPLESRIQGGNIVIPMQALIDGERRFR